MPASELQKKALYFVLFAGLIILALILFTPFDEWVRLYLAGQLDLVIEKGELVHNQTPGVPSMYETYFGVAVTLLKIVRVILMMTLVICIVRFVGYLVIKTIYRKTTQGEISSLLKTVLSVVAYIVAFFIIFQSIFPEIQLTALFTGSTIVGIVVGLALQDTLGNLFAGLALSADQPFVVGDVILISNRGEGVVESVSWRGVKIRTFQNKLLVISNSVLGKETIEVAPKNNLNAKAVFFNTLYSQSPARTIHVVRDAIRQVENVSKKMRPVVRIRNLGDNGIDFEVKYWLDNYVIQHDTDALIRQRIWYVFQRENIDFAYPTRTIHVEAKPEDAPPDEVINNIAERLNRVSIFTPLDDEEIERLANATTTRVYAPGEAIVRTGQVGNSMFVIVRGSVKIQIAEQDYLKTLNTLGENDFFGEMSLLTGQPRAANVIAVEETEVLRIDKNGLKPIIETNPSLVESISEMIEERKVLLTTDSGGPPEEAASPKKGAIKSIKKFFGLK